MAWTAVQANTRTTSVLHQITLLEVWFNAGAIEVPYAWSLSAPEPAFPFAAVCIVPQKFSLADAAKLLPIITNDY